MEDAISKLESMVQEAHAVLRDAPDHLRAYQAGRVDQAEFALEALRSFSNVAGPMAV